VSGALKVAYKAQRPFLDVVTELQALATSTRIPRSGNNAGLRLRPSIAVTLDLAQVSKGPKTAREGTLSITVGSHSGVRLRSTLQLSSCLPIALHPTVSIVPFRCHAPLMPSGLSGCDSPRLVVAANCLPTTAGRTVSCMLLLHPRTCALFDHACIC
jgi:hypothetical protein